MVFDYDDSMISLTMIKDIRAYTPNYLSIRSKLKSGNKTIDAQPDLSALIFYPPKSENKQ